VVSFGKTDEQEQVYKLGVAIGPASSQVTHFLCLNGRTQALYPYDYTQSAFMTMTMVESGNRRYLMAVDQSGWIHMMDSGNLDGNTTAINEHYASNLIYEKSPCRPLNVGIADTTCG